MATTGGFRSELSISGRLTEILETFPRVYCFRKSRINENGDKTSRVQRMSQDDKLPHPPHPDYICFFVLLKGLVTS